MLEFSNVQKSYGPSQVLNIPQLTLEPGIYWLQGSNGVGKTTLLRIIAGILSFKGDIRLQGHSIRKDPVGYRRLVSWGDAEPLYPAFLTGVDLLSFYRHILRPDAAQVEALSSRLGIGSWLGSRTAGWSSGMTKKVSLLLALLGRPALITLDEPFITLDEGGTNALTTLIDEYHRLYGTSFLLSSHQELHLPRLQHMKFSNRSIELVA